MKKVLDIMQDIQKIKNEIGKLKIDIFEYDDRIITDSECIECTDLLDKAEGKLNKVYNLLFDINEYYKGGK